MTVVGLTNVVALEAGVSYAIVGACDDDCGGLRIVLTRGGSDVAIDRGAGNVTVVRFTPRITTSYDVKVTMSDCAVSPCWYGLAVHRLLTSSAARPATPLSR